MARLASLRAIEVSTITSQNRTNGEVVDSCLEIDRKVTISYRHTQLFKTFFSSFTQFFAFFGTFQME